MKYISKFQVLKYILKSDAAHKDIIWFDSMTTLVDAIDNLPTVDITKAIEILKRKDLAPTCRAIKALEVLESKEEEEK